MDIASAMGFSGFGMQPQAKKRKLGVNDTFVDPSYNRIHEVQEAERTTNAVSGGSSVLPDGVAASGTEAKETVLPVHSLAPTGESDEVGEASRSSKQSDTPPVDIKTATLEQLRNGVRNANAKGDTVVFMPSFIEDDPWKDLKRAGGRPQ